MIQCFPKGKGCEKRFEYASRHIAPPPHPGDNVALIGYTRGDCLSLLRRKKDELSEAGLDRLPVRSDFANDEIVAIKAFLGPWPRALEAAGLKEPRKEDRLQKNREKRKKAQKRQRRANKAKKPAFLARSDNTPEENENG